MNYDHAPFILDDDGAPLQVWRGEGAGLAVQSFDMSKTQFQCGFFFAEDEFQAQQYAAPGTEPQPFYLAARNVLNLLDPHIPGVQDFLALYAGEFDEWVDRYTGQSANVCELLESGYLYDYEGDGSDARWNHLFRLAKAQGFDAVRVMDAAGGYAAPVCVVFEPAQIQAADPEPRFTHSRTLRAR